MAAWRRSTRRSTTKCAKGKGFELDAHPACQHRSTARVLAGFLPVNARHVCRLFPPDGVAEATTRRPRPRLSPLHIRSRSDDESDARPRQYYGVTRRRCSLTASRRSGRRRSVGSARRVQRATRVHREAGDDRWRRRWTTSRPALPATRSKWQRGQVGGLRGRSRRQCRCTLRWRKTTCSM